MPSKLRQGLEHWGTAAAGGLRKARDGNHGALHVGCGKERARLRLAAGTQGRTPDSERGDAGEKENR